MEMARGASTVNDPATTRYFGCIRSWKTIGSKEGDSFDEGVVVPPDLSRSRDSCESSTVISGTRVALPGVKKRVIRDPNAWNGLRIGLPFTATMLELSRFASLGDAGCDIVMAVCRELRVEEAVCKQIVL